MLVTEIQTGVAKLNAATSAASKKVAVKKSALVVKAIAAPKVNGHTHFDADEQLRIQAARIITAFNMAVQGVTVEGIVDGVRKFEKPYEGVVQ